MRAVLAWTLYWSGDLVSRVMDVGEPLFTLYPIYNRLMGWSSIVQGPSNRGPWTRSMSAMRDAVILASEPGEWSASSDYGSLALPKATSGQRPH